MPLGVPRLFTRFGEREAGGPLPWSGGDHPLVLASDVGGGIARHLQITQPVVPLHVVDLPETVSLLQKVTRVRRLLHQQQAALVVTHGVAAGLAVRLRGRSLRRIEHVEFWHGDPFFGSWPRRTAFRPWPPPAGLRRDRSSRTTG